MFIDYRLPQTTGDDVAQKLDPSIPKVLITGDHHVQTTYQFIACLEKPTKDEDIFAIIAQVRLQATATSR